MQLAACAGIEVAPSRIVALDGIAVALIRRFDRTMVAGVNYLGQQPDLQHPHQHRPP